MEKNEKNEKKSAVITKDTLNKLYHISLISKIMYFERNVRLSTFNDTMRYGTTLKDLDDDFNIPITNIPLFISMIETAMGKENSVTIEYDVKKEDFGLESKKLYTVNIISNSQRIVFYSSDDGIDEFNMITPKDTKDKSKIEKLPESYMRFDLSSEVLKMMDRSCKCLSADTIFFKGTDSSKQIKCRIENKSVPNSPVTEFKIDNISSVDADEFPWSVPMFNIIDKSMDYNVVINCGKNAILLANEESGTFYITARKKMN